VSAHPCPSSAAACKSEYTPCCEPAHILQAGSNCTLAPCVDSSNIQEAFDIALTMRTHLVAKQGTAPPGDGKPHSLTLEGRQSALETARHACIPPTELGIRLRTLLSAHSPAQPARSTPLQLLLHLYKVTSSSRIRLAKAASATVGTVGKAAVSWAWVPDRAAYLYTLGSAAESGHSPPAAPCPTGGCSAGST